VEDVVAYYRGLESRGIRRIALSANSAGGNLVLVLASRTTTVAVAM
jgi:epsilon-lactone hydrolase